MQLPLLILVRGSVGRGFFLATENDKGPAEGRFDGAGRVEVYV